MKEDRLKIPDSIPELLEVLEAEDGITPAERVKAVFTNRDCIQRMVVNDQGKFRVLEVDRFSNEDRLVEEFNTSEEALDFARKKTTEKKPYANNSSVAKVYYAYHSDGRYLGGDTWEEDSEEKST